MISIEPDIQVVSNSQATLLSAPIGDINSIDTCIRDKITKQEIMGEGCLFFHLMIVFCSFDTHCVF